MIDNVIEMDFYNEDEYFDSFSGMGTEEYINYVKNQEDLEYEEIYQDEFDEFEEFEEFGEFEDIEDVEYIED